MIVSTVSIDRGFGLDYTRCMKCQCVLGTSEFETDGNGATLVRCPRCGLYPLPLRRVCEVDE